MQKSPFNTGMKTGSSCLSFDSCLVSSVLYLWVRLTKLNQPEFNNIMKKTFSTFVGTELEIKNFG